MAAFDIERRYCEECGKVVDDYWHHRHELKRPQPCIDCGNLTVYYACRVPAVPWCDQCKDKYVAKCERECIDENG